MSRHSKNNTAGSCFTYAEKQKMGAGSKKVRLAAVSLKPFDSCSICISRVVDPMSCKKGHLFCRECILKHLLNQKRQKKQQLALYDQQQENLEKEKLLQEKKAEEDRRTEFEKTNYGLLPVAKNSTNLSKGTESSVPVGFAASTTDDGEVVYASQAQRKELEKGVDIRKQHENSGAFTKTETVTSFWVPHLAPTAKEDVIKKPEKNCECPEGQHSISQKHLIKVQFQVDKSQQTPQFLCPTCNKHLNNALKSVLFSGCGHVVCIHCSNSFVKPEGKCSVCNLRVREKDIVHLQAGGTGFAAHNKVEAKKEAPGARV